MNWKDMRKQSIAIIRQLRLIQNMFTLGIIRVIHRNN